MNKDKIDTMFERLHSEFDIEMPNDGHEQRFLDKLNAVNHSTSISKSTSSKSFWKPLLAVAATVVLCFGLFTITNNEPEIIDLASISPEYSEAQDFFTLTINKELTKLEAERSPETEAIINDATVNLNELEKAYDKLKQDLEVSGNDKRVIHAMITNFQNRIELLQTVLEYIEEVKNTKQITNENNLTI